MSARSLVGAEAENSALPVEKQVDTALHSILLVAGVLVVLILVAVAVIVYRKVFTASPNEVRVPPPPADPLAEAAAEERRGNFSGAAAHYEAGGEMIKAAECWEKAKDFARAAECWESGGDLERAAQLHVRSGSALRAAGIYMKMKNYIEAAKIFRNKGDHLRAGQALELFGNKIAAAREYTSAGNHSHAASLLEQEGLHTEAAEAYRPMLGGEVVTAAGADTFFTYATLLARAGDGERAAATFRAILGVVPGHTRAAAGLQNLPAQKQALTAPGQETELETLEPEFLAPSELPAAPVHARPVPAEPAVSAPAIQPPLPPPSLEELARLIESDTLPDGGDPLHRVFTLRSMIHAGRMEPRYSMRLWVQVMRCLAERHGAGTVIGCLTPDSIVIDMENNVRIDCPAARVDAYLSPEVQAGQPPDRQADIYSMGVILYELVCGSLDQFGSKRAGEQFSNVPPWLDELIQHCTERDLAKRYRTTEEVSAALLKLKSTAQG